MVFYARLRDRDRAQDAHWKLKHRPGFRMSQVAPDRGRLARLGHWQGAEGGGTGGEVEGRVV